MSSFDLGRAGAVALITGGASGIGRGVAEVFVEAGYRLVLADVDASTGRQAADELSALGHEVEFMPCDVADESQVAATIQAAARRWQRLDFLMNNAGVVGHQTSIENLEHEELDRVLAIDLKSVFYTCKHVIPLMRQGGGGSILNVASITADTGSAYYTAYSVAKSGVIALTRGLARQIGRFNIRINCLSPGSIGGTGLMQEYYASHPEQQSQDRLGLMKKIPMGRPGRPRDVAHLALFLASTLAEHIQGAILTIDGGESLGSQ
ncbi:MAG TPA: SDR family NAD(P)-dependent oxidoreductase [Thermoanaerobaculia bacterium]|nr:SDR family NAD(P)-dependent oxidoreductase [Thermoanaerobaculia bacterium]